MDPTRIEDALRSTLDDRRLSRGEKQALRIVLTELRPDVRDLDVIRGRAFELAREVLERREDREVVGWLEDVVRVVEGLRGERSAGAASEAAFSPGKACLGRITGLFTGARETADVCVYTITDDRITRAIERAHGRGVRVRIVSDDEKAGDRGSDLDRLAEGGVEVVYDRSPHQMHHKFAVFDGRLLLNGSYNWTRAAAEANQENVVVTDDPALVEAFAAEFERLWAEFH